MTIQDILIRAQRLRQETRLDSITPDRAGGIMYDTLAYLNQQVVWGANPLLISKIYASVSAMNEDENPVSDLTGGPLKPGQVVAIVPADPTSEDAGAVYRFLSAGEWEYVATIGDLPALYARFDAQDAEIDRRMDEQDAEIDSRMDAQDSEIAQFKEAVQNQVDNYPMVTINGNVSNAPDEEDITTNASNRLKFANRSALYGKGYVILRRNATFASQVTLQNTIYEIRYDFDLGGAVVTIPAGCELRFNGGRVTNGYIAGTLENDVIDLATFDFSDISDFFTHYIPRSGQRIFLKAGHSYTASHEFAIASDGVQIDGRGAKITFTGATGNHLLTIGNEYEQFNFPDSQVVSNGTISDPGIYEAADIGDCLAIMSSETIVSGYKKGVFCQVVEKGEGKIRIDTTFDNSVYIIRVYKAVRGISMRNVEIYNNYNNPDGIAGIFVTGVGCVLDGIVVDSVCRVTSLVNLFGYNNTIRNSRISNAGSGGATNYGIVNSGNNNKAIGNVCRNCRSHINAAVRDYQCYNWDVHNNMVYNDPGFPQGGSAIGLHALCAADIHDNLIYCDPGMTMCASITGPYQTYRNNRYILVGGDSPQKYLNISFGILARDDIFSDNIFINQAGTPVGEQTTQARLLFEYAKKYERITISGNIGFSLRTYEASGTEIVDVIISNNVLDLISLQAKFDGVIFQGNIIRNFFSNGELSPFGQNIYLNVHQGSTGLLLNANTIIRKSESGACIRLTNAADISSLIITDNSFIGVSETPNVVEVCFGTRPYVAAVWQRNREINVKNSSVDTINYAFPEGGTVRPQSTPKGFQFFDESETKPVWGAGNRWIRGDGYTDGGKSGTSANRPSNLKPADVGYMFFDTTLGKPIYAKTITSGGVVTWVDAAGTLVE